MSRIRKHFGQSAAAASLLAVALGAWAQSAAPETKRGEWWQWALSIPSAASPLIDATGANCMVGQRGGTWFLAGTFFGGSASRVCSVPEGAQLVFPVANYVSFDTPNLCGQVGSMSVAELRSPAAQYIEGLKQFTATLDSKPVLPIRRIRSEVFSLTLPAENIFNLPTVCGPGAIPAAVYTRSVDDGYYAEIDKLDVGEHMLHITATAADNTKLDVSYRLIVVPRDRRAGH
jgi:hypothetical protein